MTLQRSTLDDSATEQLRRTHAHALDVAKLLREEVELERPEMRGSTVRVKFGQFVEPRYLEELATVLAQVPLNYADMATATYLSHLDAVNGALSDFDSATSQAITDLGAAMANLDSSIGLSDRLARMITQESVRRAVQGSNQVTEIRRDVSDKGSDEGVARLSSRFSDRANEEEESAKKWNRLVMVFVFLGMFLPFAAIPLDQLLLGDLEQSYSFILKAFVSLPMFALATYSGRISAQHRRMGQHMRTLVAQLDSVKLYTADLSDEVKEDLRAAMGKRAFSEPGVLGPDGSVGIPPDQLLDKVLQVVKEVRKP